MPKPTAKVSSSERRHIPLADEITSAGHLRTKSGSKRKSRSEDETEDDHYLDSKSSKKILQIGRDLAEEDAAEARAAAEAAGIDLKAKAAFDFESRLGGEESGYEDEEDIVQYDDDAQWEDEGEVEEVEVDPNDLDMFHKFLPRDDEDPIFHPREGSTEGNGESTNLADLILEKIAAHEAGQSTEPLVLGGGAPEDAIEIPAKALEVYDKVGYLLSRYKSGPLPKPFKILPTLPYWDALLSVTKPEAWTPNAIYAGTRIFISAKPHIAQQFISMVLLERVRDDIRETKKLHVHIYNALKKALYKPACFFKGLLFPLIASGTCTLREAQIVSSVITRVSIPVLHSAAALLRLCEISAEQTISSFNAEGTGATNMFIRVFLDKKYALPYKVIDALVFHFLRFRATKPEENGEASMNGTGSYSATAARDYKLPVLWHQSLLAFAQRYRNDITEDQREALLDLLLSNGHKDIGPEVRRELLAGRGRGVVVPEAVENNGGDDTMDMTI
ncbi:SnoRNA-binding rRNA-processing protein [Trichophyton interdigitale]|uniref:rRNA processing protein Bystin n=1 Tax=Trichophyton interdigitale TaxID=101480 RepID=A0A9P5CYD1_9EURO|nr:rRNA processing protein Bystin [Trichophyton interdigitale]KAF3897216.1 rRNA processing protein Bystin [Trichophyton interdigitale]KAG8209786.1 SnoRNA-binding rRNA-processing protein [Trichophyton interdigitale]